MASDYVPIACADHERLEFAVLRRLRLKLTWHDAATGAEMAETIQPLDVATRAGAEWLAVQRADGRREDLRLDHIQRMSEV